MEQFPEKVAVGVFLTALAPDVDHNAFYVLEKVCFLSLDSFSQVSLKKT
jgi:hypothetical protein